MFQSRTHKRTTLETWILFIFQLKVVIREGVSGFSKVQFPISPLVGSLQAVAGLHFLCANALHLGKGSGPGSWFTLTAEDSTIKVLKIAGLGGTIEWI